MSPFPSPGDHDALKRLYNQDGFEFPINAIPQLSDYWASIIAQAGERFVQQFNENELSIIQRVFSGSSNPDFFSITGNPLIARLLVESYLQNTFLEWDETIISHFWNNSLDFYNQSSWRFSPKGIRNKENFSRTFRNVTSWSDLCLFIFEYTPGFLLEKYPRYKDTILISMHDYIIKMIVEKNISRDPFTLLFLICEISNALLKEEVSETLFEESEIHVMSNFMAYEEAFSKNIGIVI